MSPSPPTPSLDFTSDNTAGASPAIIDAIARCHAGSCPSYGQDALTAGVERRIREIFECDAAVLLVTTGTAANALCLSALTSPWQSVLCHRDSHVNVDECGAPEFYTGGAKLIGLPGDGAKIDPVALRIEAARRVGDVHSSQPATVSLSQATEMGRVYTLAELQAIGAICRERSLALHMDGSRFANALVTLGCTPAEMTWKAGVDALSFGATKNGALCAEAVVLFDPARGREAGFLRKRAGHLVSKARFLAAQFDAYLGDDLWLEHARHANAMARRLAAGLAATGAAELPAAPDANMVFCRLPDAVIDGLREAGFGLMPHRWGRGVVRLVTSFATAPEAVDRLVAHVAALSAGQAEPAR